MKSRLEHTLLSLLILFFTYSVNSIQAQPRYIKEAPPDPVKLLVENGCGAVQIVFRWKDGSPPANNKITHKMTDAVGSFNAIPANGKDIKFDWESEVKADTDAAKKPSQSILFGRLTVETQAFKDFSAPYTGHIIFFSEEGAAPETITYQIHKKPIADVSLYLENNSFNAAGTNFLPSFMNPLVLGILYLLLGALFLLRGKTNRALLFAISSVLILGVGLAIAITHNIGPSLSAVYTDDYQLTFSRNSKMNDSANRSIAVTNDDEEVGILTSDKNSWGTIHLIKKEGNYYLAFRDIPHAGEYKGKVKSGILGTNELAVTLRVADWVLYFFTAVVCGFLVANLITVGIGSPVDFNNKLVMAASGIIAILVTNFTLYTATWGSLLDYVKTFAVGAGINIGSRYALAFTHRVVRRWWPYK